MPRHARLKSESGLYHIILRGNNRQSIFQDDFDKEKLLQILVKYKPISGYQAFAYCLMGNHIHLLLKVGEEPIEQFMRRICGSYVFWFNQKYNRIGNLFQDRFKSEPIDDEQYFLTALRYIHNNPVKAGLVNNLDQYPWSSYPFYTQNTTDSSGFLETETVMKMFGEDSIKAIKGFIEYHQQDNTDKCLEIEEFNRISDDRALELMQTLFHIKNGEDWNKFTLQERDACLKKMKDDYNLSSRQIERITGINRKIVDKI